MRISGVCGGVSIPEINTAWGGKSTMNSRWRVVAALGLWLQVGCSGSVEMPTPTPTNRDSGRASAPPVEKPASASERVGPNPSFAVSSAMSYELYPSNKIRLGQEYRLDKSEELDPRSSEINFPEWPKRENFTDRICIQDVGDDRGRIGYIRFGRAGTVTDSGEFLDYFRTGKSREGTATIPGPVREFATIFERGERELTSGSAWCEDLGQFMINDPKRICKKDDDRVRYRYVQILSFGARLAIAAKVRFKNADDLKEFRRRFGEVDPFRLNSEDAQNREISEFLKARASLSIHAIQLGGDSGATASIIEQFKQRTDRVDLREAREAFGSISKKWGESLKKQPVSDADLGHWAIISLGMRDYRFF